MNYQKTYKKEIQDKDLKGMDEKSKLILFKILGIPKDVKEYIITVQKTEFWTERKE